MIDVCFVISHYASQPAHNVALSHCLLSLFEHYPGMPIYVVDDGSPLPFYVSTMLPQDTLMVSPITWVANPVQRSGELGALYWYYSNPVHAYAFILHDSMLALRSINLPQLIRISDAWTLWHFEWALHYHVAAVDEIFAAIHGADTDAYKSWMQVFSRLSGWAGSMGMAVLISHTKLQLLQNQYKLFDCMSKVQWTRNLRQGGERVLGVMLAALTEYKQFYSLCGSIFQHPHQDSQVFSQMSYAEKQAFKESYAAPFLKTWYTR